jgi:hypothetical protein
MRGHPSFEKQGKVMIYNKITLGLLKKSLFYYLPLNPPRGTY